MILVCGDLILDILVKVDGPINYGSDTTGRISLEGGGSAANFAAWTAYLGGEVTFIGKIGEDIAGSYLKEDLKQWGVKTILLTSADHPSGKILIFVDEKGERTMITDRGVNLTFSPEELPADIFRKVRHFHLTGYSLFGSEVLIETTKKAIKLARENGLSISIDPSSYALLKEFGAGRFLEITANCDFIFPNLDEGRVLTGLEEEKEIVKYLLDYYRTVVLKLGKGGCLIGNSRGIFRVYNDKTVDNPDTTGAGDAFAAGFIHCYLKDKGDILQAGNFANQVACKCINKGGGRPPVNKE